jgi:hypothetical protein
MDRRRLRFDRLVPAQNLPAAKDNKGRTMAFAATDSGTGIPDVRAKPRDMSLRDWAIFLLHNAAEVEHALMVQYLFAMYSLNPEASGPSAHNPGTTVSASRWASQIRRVAIEEMGHLLTVQNILRFIGGPLNFDREDFPLRTNVYPFPFELEPLSRDTLAKYIYAEMPGGEIDPNFIDPPFDPPERQTIEDRAMAAAGVKKEGFVNHVGTLYATLLDVFHSPEFKDSKSAGFPPDTANFQAMAGNPWQKTFGNNSIQPNASGVVNLVGPRVLIINSLQDVLDALDFIARQGEASGDNPTDSHFERFLKIYREFPEPGAIGWDVPPTFPVSTNPSTEPKPVTAGTILHSTTNLWARLFDLRYRILLTSLVHATAISGYEAKSGAVLPTDTYAMLVQWVFDEMIDRTALCVSDLARFLARMPSADSPEAHTAGAPFTMPYTLAIPDQEGERWQYHLDLLASSASLIAELQQRPSVPQFPIFDDAKAKLQDLLDADNTRRTQIAANLKVA